LDFSVTGLIYCTMMMFIGLAAINTQANLLFGVFGLMIGILLVSFFISGLVIKKLHTERVVPDWAIVGRPKRRRQDGGGRRGQLQYGFHGPVRSR